MSAEITDKEAMALARVLDARATPPSPRVIAPVTVALDPHLETDTRGYVASLPNILKALRTASLFDVKIRRDKFLDAILLRVDGEWRRFTDTDYVTLDPNRADVILSKFFRYGINVRPPVRRSYPAFK
jgi:hypothetical protein